MSIRWMQQKICTVHKPQVSHSDACQAKVGEVLSDDAYDMGVNYLPIVYLGSLLNCLDNRQNICLLSR